MSSPAPKAPAKTILPPIQMITRLAPFMISIMIGIFKMAMLTARMAELVRLSFAFLNFCISKSSRT